MDLPFKLEADAAIGIAIGIVVLSLCGSTYYFRNAYHLSEARLEAFRASTAALGEAAKANKIKKETDDAKTIADALAARDDALRRLRDATRPRGSVLPGVPAGAVEPGRICFDRAAVDAALQRYAGGVEGLIAEGDAAVIDVRAWLNAWPRSP